MLGVQDSQQHPHFWCAWLPVPGPHCPGTQGLPATESSTSSELQESSGAENELASTATDKAHVASDITVDEEAMLQAKLKQLHIAEQALQKTNRVALLEKVIKQRLATLSESSQPSFAKANHTSPPFAQSAGLGLANTNKQGPPQLPLEALLAGAKQA